MPSNIRRCLSCRKVASKEEFLRVVRLYPSHEISIDDGMGRSAYLCPTPNCIQTAQRKDRLSRALKAPVPPIIYQTLKQKQTDTSSHPQPELY
ncbi:YlxR family protein [Pseudanabaenaceae cyanobacterium LEGE 13415]|nr:YlxR family protein [Pseudanabaenaceae cyanobacterium LEGE 13415]